MVRGRSWCAWMKLVPRTCTPATAWRSRSRGCTYTVRAPSSGAHRPVRDPGERTRLPLGDRTVGRGRAASPPDCVVVAAGARVPAATGLDHLDDGTGSCDGRQTRPPRPVPRWRVARMNRDTTVAMPASMFRVPFDADACRAGCGGLSHVLGDVPGDGASPLPGRTRTATIVGEPAQPAIPRRA